MPARFTLPRLWPRRVGNQCLLMLAAGLTIGLIAPMAATGLDPLATLFLQVSQVVVLPYLIVELMVGFGGLRSAGIRSVLQGGLLVLAGLLALAGALVVVLPPLLPDFEYSGFFRWEAFQALPSTDLVRTFVPSNIFQALAEANYPAVVLFSSVLGILLQRLEGRDALLPVLEQIRLLFASLNHTTLRIVPFGILALSATNAARLDLAQLARIQGLLLLCLTAFVLLSLLLAGLVLGLTPLSAPALWRIVRGPLAFTASSANLIVALPMLVSGLEEELPRARARLDGPRALPSAADRERARELAPLVWLGYALPGLGQVACLLIVPFAGWYVNQPLGMGRTALMLATGIPSTVAGVSAVLRQELLRQGLPLSLLDIVTLNGPWIYRFEKVLTLFGLVSLAVLVYFLSARAMRWRPLPLLAGLAAALVTATSLMAVGRHWIALSLAGSYRNDEVLMSLPPALPGPDPLRDGIPLPQPVTLESIRRRGSLRVGLREDGLPWSFRNGQGRLVGYDVDLVRALADSLELRLEVHLARQDTLLEWLDQGRLDLVGGGILNSSNRALRHRESRGYQQVHLALVVPDPKVGRIQRLRENPDKAARLVIAVTDSELLSPQLNQQMTHAIGSERRSLRLAFVPLPDIPAFFTASGASRYDALLTTAEGGAAWAVLHPQFNLLTPFGDRLPSELVLLLGGEDPRLLATVNSWVLQEESRGLMDQLFDHWVLVEETGPQRRRSRP